MKFATRKNGTRDGELLVVSRDLESCVAVPHIATNLREAIEAWQQKAPRLNEVYEELNAGRLSDAKPLEFHKLHSPLPRSFQWADGSAFIHHIKLVRQARKAPLPDTLLTVPLIYQGGGDDFLGPYDPIPQIDYEHGTDLEGEIGVILDDTPMGVDPVSALERVRLLVSINDVSLRGLVSEELKQGFGFFQSKPSTSFGPIAVTPDEVAEHWQNGRLHLNLNVEINGRFFGNANAGAMHFHFGEIIAHAARTRNLRAGCIIGSGTVSNEDAARGSSCLAEKRMIEVIQSGEAITQFLRPGDEVRIWVETPAGQNVFGDIKQTVIAWPG